MKKWIAGVLAAVMTMAAAVSVSASEVAKVRFFGDSDVGKYYMKLSTKWENADYAALFSDQDAYIIDFKGAPKLSATSRADLEIYYPFTDEEGNATVDPEDVNIYQVVDGGLYNVTGQFTFQANKDGAAVFATRTRFLGTYILCEKPVEELDLNGESPLAKEDGYSLSDSAALKKKTKTGGSATGVSLPSFSEK